MRILALAHSLIYSGAQIATLEFLRVLKNHAEVKVITCKNAVAEFTSNLEAMGLNVFQVPCDVNMGYPKLSIENVKKHIEWADVVWITDIEYHVASGIKRTRKVPVVAHLHSYAFICPWWGAMYGLKEVCTMRCSAWRIVRCKQGFNVELARVGLLDGVRAKVYWLLDFGKGPLDYFRWRRVMDSAVDSIDLFVAVSNATREVVVSHLPEVRDRVEVVYNPAAHRPWRYVSSLPERRSNYIFYAGGANPQKGPHILLMAFKLLREWGVNVELVMTGTAGTWVEALARRYGVGQGVRFLEKLPEGGYFRLMAGAGATVLPSVWPEPLPTVAIESVSLGVPVVGSGLGGIPEIIDGYGAVTSPLPEKMAEAVAKVLKTHYGREDMRKYAFEKFGDGNVERFLSLLASLVK